MTNSNGNPDADKRGRTEYEKDPMELERAIHGGPGPDDDTDDRTLEQRIKEEMVVDIDEADCADAIAPTQTAGEPGDWMTDLQAASRGMCRLDYDRIAGEMGAAATDDRGVEVPCPDCGFANRLWVLVRQRECTDCGRAMVPHIDYCVGRDR